MAADAARRTIDLLQRDLLLATTEMLFERYLRLQHRQHIARLHQAQVAAQSATAERHHLVR